MKFSTAVTWRLLCVFGLCVVYVDCSHETDRFGLADIIPPDFDQVVESWVSEAASAWDTWGVAASALEENQTDASGLDDLRTAWESRNVTARMPFALYYNLTKDCKKDLNMTTFIKGNQIANLWYCSFAQWYVALDQCRNELIANDTNGIDPGYYVPIFSTPGSDSTSTPQSRTKRGFSYDDDDDDDDLDVVREENIDDGSESPNTVNGHRRHFNERDVIVFRIYYDGPWNVTSGEFWPKVTQDVYDCALDRAGYVPFSGSLVLRSVLNVLLMLMISVHFLLQQKAE